MLGQLGAVREGDTEAEPPSRATKPPHGAVTDHVHGLFWPLEPADRDDVHQEAGREGDEATFHDGEVVITDEEVGKRRGYAQDISVSRLATVVFLGSGGGNLGSATVSSKKDMTKYASAAT